MKSRFSVSMAVWFLLTVSLAITGGAFAEINVWLPHINVHKHTAFAYASSPWGKPDSPIFNHIDDINTDNPVWNADGVYWEGNESWFAPYESNKSGAIYIHNPTGTNYSAANNNRIVLYVYLASTGSLADENATYDRWGTGTPTSLIYTADENQKTWDETNNYFLIEVGAYKTTVINMSNASNTNQLFNNPASSADYMEHAQVAIRLKQSSDSNRFSAIFRGQGAHHAREGLSTYDLDLSHIEIGYQGVPLSDYVQGDDTLILPYFREKREGTTPSVAERATLVYVVNTYSSTDSIEVTVCDLNGNPVHSTQTFNVAPNARLGFAPSQFFTSGTDVQGYVKIVGQQPVGIAFNMRFPKQYETADSEYLRDFTNHCLPLMVNP